MEENHEDMIRWRKTGGGSFRMGNGKIIKPNQVFWAKEEDIPQSFRDIIVPLSEIPKDEPPVEAISHEYQIQHREKGWYDIVDSHDKVVNDKALRQDKAKEMIEALMS